MNKKLSSNMEDYLETIAFLEMQKGVVRVKDIGMMLKVKKPSVSGALNVLSKEGLIIHEPYRDVRLTPEGKKVANKVWSRHSVITKFLTQILKIDESTADEDACKMEHTISRKTFDRLIKFIEFSDQTNESNHSNWLKDFNCFLNKGKG